MRTEFFFKYNKCNVLAIFSLLIAFSGVRAQDDDTDFLYGFLEGTYQVIGRWPDSDDTYTGKVVLKRKGNQLQVIRSINGDKVQGVGRIAHVTADKISVLKVQFVHHDKHYEATYLIHSDLDNYVRLSGYLYLKSGETKQPGLEALFIHH
jgi:hypothetical protein